MAEAQRDYVDAHFHIWDLKKFEYPWPTADLTPIYRQVTAQEYGEAIHTTPVRHGVFVQCLNSNPDEAIWVMKEAETNGFIKGVVAGVDLTSPKLDETLDGLKKYPLFKGVRHILDMEDAKWITRDDVHKGLKVLEERSLTYDLLLRPPLLQYIPSVVEKFPRLKFVVDHIAKPYIKDQKINGWKEEMAAIAKYPNVHCKLSGLVTEADLSSWKKEDFIPYIQHVVDIFGLDRCMYGSDWPVCSLASASYNDVYSLLENLLPSLTENEKLKLFRNNARDFYNLNI